MAQVVDPYDIELTTLEGRADSLGRYRGRVLLVVNVASRCGFTPQYRALEELHRAYCERGLSVLGFPCNQFGAQEPGDAAQIRDFCTLTYQVSFPLFARTDVNGPRTHPLYRYLKSHRRGFLTPAVKWNFTKFLLDRQAGVVARYGPSRRPETIAAQIERLL